ncbi:flagellar basal body L-ring protein FlgH [Chitinilyticum piscinae]|uniref:Flagellar L-ring protein n=1 Tax=Chitinilyticum piscinae TaxID=2866724 RepID=A0A8J7K2P4_9NEIS|nr:flagellar basal body L-ring protein FlgH [Chitinilyticum piscinae]MBE9610766.1 flagellar basal body L-ring protein FlgH [Chitinilyticum piscinae]
MRVFQLGWLICIGVLALLLQGCVAPATIVTKPVTAKPQPQASVESQNGSIYQASTARLLFEEPNARFVGDVLMITLEENLTAANKANSKTDRSGKLSVSGSGSAPYFPNALEKLFNASITASGSNVYDGSGETNSTNTIRGSIAVTVIDVYPNGNLQVGGEKQISVNGEINTLRFTGVINPRDVKAGNTVSSTRVADARIEQVGVGAIGDANTMGWLQRFFLTAWPF